jgi:enoyl-CoA hydratase/carnithine racemase
MIEHTREGVVHVVTMRSDQNLLDLPFLARLHEALDQVEAESEGDSALVLTGEGKFFSNGLNLPELRTLEAPEMARFNEELRRAVGRLVVSPVPTVAAVNGHAFAAGAVLALPFDYRIMREDRGWWCLSEVDLGMAIPPPIMALVTARLPATTVRDAVLAGKRFSADEAIGAGLADGKAPEAELLSKAVELAGSLAGKNRNVIRTMKVTLWGDVARGLGVEPG